VVSDDADCFADRVDASYFRARANEERDRAKSADRRDAALIHLELARKYEALIQDNRPRPKLHIGWGNMPNG
jgi:hypothetical protein